MGHGDDDSRGSCSGGHRLQKVQMPLKSTEKSKKHGAGNTAPFSLEKHHVSAGVFLTD